MISPDSSYYISEGLITNISAAPAAAETPKNKSMKEEKTP